MVVAVTNLQEKLPINSSRIKKLIRKILKKEEKSADYISVAFVNSRIIKRLNRKFLKKSRATDVLSFNNSVNIPRKITAWEIVICTDTALLNAKIFKTTPDTELQLYLAHGLLHLLGYDDNNPKNRRVMRRKEKAIIKI